jgi:hypothetical protein
MRGVERIPGRVVATQPLVKRVGLHDHHPIRFEQDVYSDQVVASGWDRISLGSHRG